jgi:hypothetical protein
MTELTSEFKNAEATASKYNLDPTWKSTYKLGAALLAACGALGFVLFLMGAKIAQYASGVASNPTSSLQLLSQHQLLYASDASIWVISDFFLIPVSIAAYLVLRPVNKNAALVGSALVLFYAVFDICVTELNSLTLLSLSQGFASAGTASLQATYVAASTYGVAALSAQTVFSFGIGAVGQLIWSIVMWKSVFGRGIASLGVVANILPMLGAAASVVPSSGLFLIFGLARLLALPVGAIWAIWVGVRLYRYTRHLAVSSFTKEQQATMK